MKAKVTKPDGTVIELEGEAMELAIFLPDLKGFELRKYEPISIPTPFFMGSVRCTCNDAWFGITPPPPCPLHSKLTLTVTYTNQEQA